MSNEIFPHIPNSNPASSSYASTEAELLNRQNLETQRLELLTDKVQRLHHRLGWMTGLSVAALAIAAAQIGLTISVKLQQDQQTHQVGTLTGNKAGVENQVNSLSQQIAALQQQVTANNQQVTSLNQQLSRKASQSQVEQLATTIREVNSNAVTKEQLNQALQGLQRVQSNSNNGGQSSTASSTASPSP